MASALRLCKVSVIRRMLRCDWASHRTQDGIQELIVCDDSDWQSILVLIKHAQTHNDIYYLAVTYQLPHIYGMVINNGAICMLLNYTKLTSAAFLHD